MTVDELIDALVKQVDEVGYTGQSGVFVGLDLRKDQTYLDIKNAVEEEKK